MALGGLQEVSDAWAIVWVEVMEREREREIVWVNVLRSMVNIPRLATLDYFSIL